MNFTQCQVCQDATSKYKCPTCRLQYCSVGCYRSHRENECETPPAQPCVEMEFDREGNVTSTHYLFPTDDTVMPDTLQQLRGSSKLRSLLKNPHLRALVQEVDRSSSKIQPAMMEPIFTEFADQVLSIVEPPEDADSDKDD